MTDITLDELDAELANTCAGLLKLTLTAAQAHSDGDQNPQLADAIAHLSEARLVIYAREHDLVIELLAPAGDGGTVQLFRLGANSAPSWSLQ